MFKVSAFLFACVLVAAQSYKVMLPPGKNAESVVHIGGNNYLLSDSITGSAMMLDTRTNRIFTVVRSPESRLVQGVAHDASRDLVFLAGSGEAYYNVLENKLKPANVLNLSYPKPQPYLYMYNLTTGLEYQKCTFKDMLMFNDIAFDEGYNYAWVTDSKRPAIYRFDLNRLPTCEVTEIKLREDIFTGEQFYAAGIAYFNKKGAEGLFIFSFAAETLVFLDLKTGEQYPVAERAGGCDGIKLVRNGNCLLTAYNDGKVFNSFRITVNSAGRVSADLTKIIQDPDFTELTSVAVNGRTLVATNEDIEVLGSTGQLWVTVKKVSYDLC